MGAFVAPATVDVQQLEPALEHLGQLPEELGRAEHLLADTGYMSRANVQRCEAAGIVPLIAIRRDEHHPGVLERFAPEPAEPPGDDPVLRLHHRLATRHGKALYARRKTTSEPVFGVIKHVMGLRQFLLRGLEAVNGEWDLVSIAWNLRRMHTMRLVE